MDIQILEQLKKINERLTNIEIVLDIIKKDSNNVAKYVPFVDSLSRIGIVEVFNYFNPLKLINKSDKSNVILDE